MATQSLTMDELKALLAKLLEPVEMDERKVNEYTKAVPAEDA